MRYGIYLPNFGPYGEARALAALARDAEEAGWDGFFIWDHIVGDSGLPTVDPWVGLAAAAMTTSRIRLGTTVTPLPRRRPWKLARETASLDRLSGGRLILGVGIGMGQSEWDDLGEQTDPRVRGAMLDKGLAVLTGLWTGQPFSYEGQYYHVRDACFQPAPVQQPRIPIWVGGWWPTKAPFKRAARWDGVFPLASDWDRSPARYREIIDFVRAERGNDTPFDVVAMGVSPDEPAERAAMMAGYAAVGVTWWLELIAPYRFGEDDLGRQPWPVDDLRAAVLQGPPQSLEE